MFVENVKQCPPNKIRSTDIYCSYLSLNKFKLILCWAKIQEQTKKLSGRLNFENSQRFCSICYYLETATDLRQIQKSCIEWHNKIRQLVENTLVFKKNNKRALRFFLNIAQALQAEKHFANVQVKNLIKFSLLFIPITFPSSTHSGTPEEIRSNYFSVPLPRKKLKSLSYSIPFSSRQCIM